MTAPGLLPRILAAGVVLSVQSLGTAVSAEAAQASLTGTIVSATDHTPLSGARVHAGDPKTGRIYSSQPTTADGSFSVEALPASGYELAVEADGGLYIVQTPVQLAPGTAPHLTVAVNRDQNGDDGDDDDDDSAGVVPQGGKFRGISIWDNRLTAAGLVLGLAFVIGALIEDATIDPDIIMSNPNPGG